MASNFIKKFTTNIVSFYFDEELAKLCNRCQIPYMPEYMTITEMNQALAAVVDDVNLFPGSAFGTDLTSINHGTSSSFFVEIVKGVKQIINQNYTLFERS